MGSFPFLQLPAETRLQIYGHMAIPDTEPFSDYSGLYYSCRQVKAEIEDECGKILGEHLRAIKAEAEADQPERFAVSDVYTVPDSFIKMQHVRLDFGHLKPYVVCDLNRRYFTRFMPTRFASLTVVLPRSEFGASFIVRSLFFIMKKLPREPMISKVRFNNVEIVSDHIDMLAKNWDDPLRRV